MANIVLKLTPNVTQLRVDKGLKGDTGEKGDKGDTGAGVASGGTTGQHLVKKSNTNYDTEWQTLNLTTNDVTEVTNKKYVTDDNLNTIKNSKNLISTGILSGGNLIINSEDATKFDLGAGTGIIINNYSNPNEPVLHAISWSEQTGITDPYINDADTTYVNIDSDYNLFFTTEPLTEAQRRDYIAVGWLDHSLRTVIEFAQIEPFFVADVQSQFNDFIENFGAFNINGNVYSALSGLTVERSAGKTFDGNAGYSVNKKNPNIVETNSESPAYFYYYYRDGSNSWNTVDAGNNIDPEHYDDGTGTLASVPSGKFTIQPISFYALTESNDIQYGQKVYDTLVQAENQVQDFFELNPYNAFDTFRGWLIVQQGCTDLTNVTQAKIVSAGKLGLIDISSSGGSGGEVNTASNIGLSGQGLFNAKVGVDLQFKNINGSGVVTVTNNSGQKTLDISITEDTTHRFVTDTQLTIIGNQSGTNTGDETDTTIKTKLGITTLSGSNTGDETDTTIKTKLGITTLSGSNTGDETDTTIKTKLGITTLSGSNTGDEDTTSIKTKLGAANTSSDGYLSSTDWNTFSGKQSALGYTAENTANKVTSFQATPDNTHYASEKLVKDSLDTLQNNAMAYAIIFGG